MKTKNQLKTEARKVRTSNSVQELRASLHTVLDSIIDSLGEGVAIAVPDEEGYKIKEIHDPSEATDPNTIYLLT